MAKKYILEIEEKKDGSLAWASFDSYTEPDLEHVRKEAYDKGWKEAEDHYDEGYSDGHDAGLDDAWKAARKIIRMPEGDLLNLFDVYSSVCTSVQVMLKYDASEAIAKIKEYEDGKQEYRVGDEFENGAGQKFVVLKMDGKEIDRYIDGDGKTYVMDEKYRVMRKTGRSFPEIASILQKMRGKQE